MTQRSGILAGGNWIVDKVKFIDTYPAQDALANILSESFGNGGSPFNVLKDLAKLEAPFPLSGVGLIGADSAGEWIKTQCRSHGIDQRQIATHPHAPTSYTDVMTVKSDGRRTFFHRRGANAFLDIEHFDFSASNAKIFHLGYLLLLDKLDLPDEEFGTVAARLLYEAKSRGFETSIDLVSEDSERFSSVIHPVLPYVDYCILNEFELERSAEIKIKSGNQIDLNLLKQAAFKMLDLGIKKSIIVHFPDGACAVQKESPILFQGSVKIPSDLIVSSVGAGDAFAAGLLYGIHENLPMKEALKFGVCAAASCLKGTGSSNSVPALNEALELGDQYGFREIKKLKQFQKI